MVPHKNNTRGVKRKKFFAMPEGKVMHHIWKDGRMMMCTESSKKWLDRRKRSDVWTNELWQTTVIKRRGKSWSGTDKIGQTEEILVEPRNKARIHIIQVFEQRFRKEPELQLQIVPHHPASQIPTAAGGAHLVVLEPRSTA